MTLTFIYNDGRITLADYFRKMYAPKAEIRDMEQILFKVKGDVYLPPELCTIDGVPD